MATSNARQRVQQQRTNLVLDQPFFGALALKLVIEEVTHFVLPDGTVKPLLTAATDGTHLFYNPAFVDMIPDAELLGVLVHEVMHCACGHMWRIDGREIEKSNRAMDYAINYIVESSGFKLPSFRLRADEYDGKSFEWIYPRLKDDDGAGGGSGTDAMPGCGGCDVMPASAAGKDGEPAATESDWQQAVAQAAQAAKARGSLPSYLERFAKIATEPRVDWRSVLRRFVQAAAKEDYVWTRPSTRYLARGLYLPSLRSETMGPIAVCIDTSGSIDDVTLSLFAAEVNAIMQELRPERIVAIYCDAAVDRVDVFERDDAIALKPCGGGGTDFRPAIARAAEDEPVCCIYLTDGQGAFPSEPTEFPTLWALTMPTPVPFGETVSLESV